MNKGYGIPDLPAKADALHTLVGANYAALGEVATAAVTPLGQVVSANDGVLGSIRSTLTRSLAGRAARGRKSLAEIGRVAVTAVAAHTAVLQSQKPVGTWHLDPSDPYGPAIDPPIPPPGQYPPGMGPPSTLPPSPLPRQDIPPAAGGAAGGLPQDAGLVWYATVAPPNCGVIGQTFPGSGAPAGTLGNYATRAEAQAAADAYNALHHGCLPPSVPTPTGTFFPPVPTPQAGASPPAAVVPQPQSQGGIGTPPGVHHKEYPPYVPLTCEPLLIPVPGSVEWCEGFQGLVDRLVKLGSDVWERLGQLIACVGIDTQGFDEWVASLNIVLQQSFAWLAGLAESLILATPIPCVVEQVKGLVNDVRGSVLCVAGCDATVIWYISVARGFVRMLKNLRLGTDAGVWATFDFELTVDPLDRTIEYILNQVCPIEVPQPAEAIECYLRGECTQGQAECWLAMRGIRWDIIYPTIYARRERLSEHELIQWSRRHDMGDDWATQQLRNMGWLDPADRAARVELFDELPTIADHLHWLTRNVFDLDYVRDFRLMEGFEERFWPVFGHDLRSQGMKKEYAEKHYAAHWITPAPGQLQEMVYRLRPDKAGVQHPFTVADYGRMLTEQDVAPYFRERFTEIVYRVPALSYLRDMYRSYLLTDEEMQSYHQDLGYSPEDSDRFVHIDKLVRERIRHSEAHGWTPSALAKAYVSGQIDDRHVVGEMGYMGYTEEESRSLMFRARTDLQYTVFSRARGRAIFALATRVRKSVRLGILSQGDAVALLVGQGWPEDYSRSMVETEHASAAADRVSHAVNRVRQSYLHGDIDIAAAGNMLTGLGIVPDAIASYLAVWQMELTPRRKRRTAAQIVKDVSEDMLSTDEAIARLTNLGYDNSDTMLFLADAQRAISKRQAAQRATQDRQARAAAKETDRLRKEAEKQSKQLLSALKRLSPPAKLQKWAKLGIISERLFRSRMKTFGFDDADITRWWNEACKAKAAQCQPVDIGPQGNGSSGTSQSPAGGPASGSPPSVP